MSCRNYSIDSVKGFLILCVIIGHVLLGSLEQNVFRYVIYSFHMPLFMFVSGYLIDVEKLSHMTMRDLFFKYWNRMIKMWLIAFVVFFMYLIMFDPTWSKAFEVLYYPWYHLWYVPTLFSYVLTVYVFFRGKKQPYLILVFLSLLWIVLLKVCPPNSLPRWCDCKQLPYFALGLYLKNHLDIDRLLKHAYRLVLLLYFPVLLLVKKYSFFRSELISFLLLLSIIVFFLYPSIKRDLLPHNNVLCYIGRHSLNVYLWHMVPIVVLKDFVHNTAMYYLISFSLLFFYIVLVKCKLCKT